MARAARASRPIRQQDSESRQQDSESRHAAAERRSRRVGLRRLLGVAAFLPLASKAPLYARLFWELVRDERTPAARKALLAAALGYLLLGRDIVPDDLPLVGGLDDLIVVVIAVDLFLDGVPGDVLDEKLDQLGIDRREFGADVARIRRFMPRPLRRLVRQVPGMISLTGATLHRSGLGPRVRAWINKEGSIA